MRTCSQLPPIRLAQSDFSLDCGYQPSSQPDATQTALHLDVAYGELDLKLRPKSFRVLLDYLPDPVLRVAPDGLIHARIPIRDNAIGLWLHSLAVFQGMRLDGPEDLDFEPDRLMIGDYGGLHLIVGAEPDWYRYFADPDSYLNLRALHCLLGMEAPLAACLPIGSDAPPPEPEYCEAYAEDEPSTPLVLREFAAWTNPLLDIQLTNWLPVWLREPNGRMAPELPWMDLLRRWADRPAATTDWEALFDRLEFYDGTKPRRFGDLVRQIEANLDLDVFSLQLNDAELFGARVERASLREADQPAYLHHVFLKPGLHARWDLASADLQVEANLQIDIQATLPWLGAIRIRSPLLVSAAFTADDERIKLREESLRFAMPSIQLELPDRRLAIEAALRIQNQDESWMAWLDFMPAGGGRYQSEWQIEVFTPAPFVSDPLRPDFGLRWRLDVSRDSEPFIEGAEGQFQRIESADAFAQRRSLHFLSSNLAALRLPWLKVDNAALDFEIQKHPSPNGTMRFTVPRFEVSGQAEGERPHWRIGKFSLAQRDILNPLRIEWFPEDRVLAFDRLDLRVAAQGGSRALQFLKRVGIDGRVAGDFRFDLINGSGEGDLRLLGDSAGDVYLLTRAGRPVEPPLFRRTDWRFRRVDRFYFARGFAIGRFRLTTEVNTGALAQFGYGPPMASRIVMSHRDVMLKPGGIDAANRSYYRRLRSEREAEK